MPSLPTIANVYRVAFNWTLTTGGNATNVHHYRAADSSPGQVFNDIVATVTRPMWVCATANAKVTQIDITYLGAEDATVEFPVVENAKWLGSGGSEFVPQGCQLVKFTTVKRGKHYRGRSFVPFIAEGSQTNGVLLAADVANAQTAWANYKTGIAALGTELVVASYSLATAQAVTACTVEAFMFTQRRRAARLRS